MLWKIYETFFRTCLRAWQGASTKFCERKPFTKFGAIEPPFDVLIVGKRSGSITSTFLKRHSSEKIVLWNRHCLSFMFAMDNTAAARFDSTKFSEKGNPSEIWCYRTALRCPRCRKKQRFKSTKFSHGFPFRKFGAIEPPFDVLIVGKRSGSIKQTFLKRHSSEKLVLWNRHCLSLVFAIDNTAVQRFDRTKFSERKPF